MFEGAGGCCELRVGSEDNSSPRFSCPLDCAIPEVGHTFKIGTNAITITRRQLADVSVEILGTDLRCLYNAIVDYVSVEADRKFDLQSMLVPEFVDALRSGRRNVREQYHSERRFHPSGRWSVTESMASNVTEFS